MHLHWHLQLGWLLPLGTLTKTAASSALHMPAAVQTITAGLSLGFCRSMLFEAVAGTVVAQLAVQDKLVVLKRDAPGADQ